MLRVVYLLLVWLCCRRALAFSSSSNFGGDRFYHTPTELKHFLKTGEMIDGSAKSHPTIHSDPKSKSSSTISSQNVDVHDLDKIPPAEEDGWHEEGPDAEPLLPFAPPPQYEDCLKFAGESSRCSEKDSGVVEGTEDTVSSSSNRGKRLRRSWSEKETEPPGDLMSEMQKYISTC